VTRNAQQQREPEPVVPTTPFRDQLPVRVVQENSFSRSDCDGAPRQKVNPLLLGNCLAAVARSKLPVGN
jgi:hypothetical protein